MYDMKTLLREASKLNTQPDRVAVINGEARAQTACGEHEYLWNGDRWIAVIA